MPEIMELSGLDQDVPKRGPMEFEAPEDKSANSDEFPWVIVIGAVVVIGLYLYLRFSK